MGATQPVTLLALAAAVEAATGRLLLGADLSGAGTALGRVAGFGLLALGVACWPGAEATDRPGPALRAMVTYNLLATMYLAYLGAGGELGERLLWPAVAIHTVLTVLLVRAWVADPQT